MREVYICDATRTPIGRYGGVLAGVRPDDMAAHVIRVLLERNHGIDKSKIDDVILGCANQAGEDNRNVARMALLLAGLPVDVPGMTVNRLCGSGMEAVGAAARAIKAGEADLIIAGGVESMTRAPWVMGKNAEPWSRNNKLFDSTLGWRFINPELDRLHGTDSMMETAENLAREFSISRADQDAFALNSQEKALAAIAAAYMADEISPLSIAQPKAEPIVINQDEHPRRTSLEKLATLKALTAGNGSITAGNSSGINDGAAALIIASEEAVRTYGLKPRARILGMAAAGVAPRIMGIGPVPATQKLLKRLGLNLTDFSIIELNEAFAAQALACIRELGLKDNDPRINPQGGAIALGHPLGMSGARLITTALYQLERRQAGELALCTMCIGVGQGISLALQVT